VDHATQIRELKAHHATEIGELKDGVRELIDALEDLAALNRDGPSDHEFWADDDSIVDGTVDLNRLAGHKQITDIYLLGLAVTRKGRFSSVDTHVPKELVRGGAEAYEVV
jgi:hypothetical protein